MLSFAEASMKTIIPYSSLEKESWAEDLSPASDFRQKYMFVQCMGHYLAKPSYAVMRRKNLHSYLLLYTKKGRGLLEYQNHSISLTAGYSALINCDDVHSYYCAPDGEWDFFWTHFSGNCIDGYLSEIMNNWNIDEEDMGDVFTSLYRHAKGNTVLDAIEASTEIINICSKYLVYLKSTGRRDGKALSPIVQNAILLFEERMMQPLSLDSVCSELHINKYYFSHIFKQQTGISPYNYIILFRLSNAKALLRSTSDSIESISSQCGFGSCSYFIHIFRDQVGMTPLAYRNYFLQLTDT